MKRRSLLKMMLSLPVMLGWASTRAMAGGGAGRVSGKPHVLVVGAGAFGGWTALNLLRSGARVTLVDAWEAGNGLSSSGGESRVIRHAYASRVYVDMAQRALELWKEHDRLWGTRLFHPKGVLFMVQGGDFLEQARRHMTQAGVEFEALDAQALVARYPQINPERLRWGLLEPTAGYLSARQACGAVRDAFVREGGEFRLGQVRPGGIRGGEMEPPTLEDGTEIRADHYVFACGAWLKQMFPSVLGDHLSISRQEIHFFRTPQPSRQAFITELPVWADVGEKLWYGIPGVDGLFKVADDTRGAEVDPTTHERAPTREGVEAARQFMEYRFPGMQGAQHVDARVCQYSGTTDSDFIVDRHPAADNAWLLGGGSGHGFKHGPALGEMVAAQVLGTLPLVPRFSVRRFG
jgi:glycine/D-amino acid oxidase-like deaminating enzyme